MSQYNMLIPQEKKKLQASVKTFRKVPWLAYLDLMPIPSANHRSQEVSCFFLHQLPEEVRGMATGMTETSNFDISNPSRQSGANIGILFFTGSIAKIIYQRGGSGF